MRQDLTSESFIISPAPLDVTQCFIQRLPLELLIRILKALRNGRIPKSELDYQDEPKGLTARHRLIKSLAETNKYFNSVVTPFLYERIVFEYERVPSTTLKKRSDLLPAVREIVFSAHAKPWGTAEYPDIEVLLQLRNVHTIILRHNPLTPGLIQLIRNNTGLRHLALAETSDEFDKREPYQEDYGGDEDDEDHEDHEDDYFAAENLSFDKDSLQDSSALAEHTELKEVTIYAGSLLADPTVAHAEFTQFFASSITKLPSTRTWCDS